MNPEWEIEEERRRRSGAKGRPRKGPRGRRFKRPPGFVPWIFRPGWVVPIAPLAPDANRTENKKGDERRSRDASSGDSSTQPADAEPADAPSVEPLDDGAVGDDQDAGGDEEFAGLFETEHGGLVAEAFEWECELCGSKRSNETARRSTARSADRGLALDDSEVFEFPFP